jgi:hypothetical protein
VSAVRPKDEYVTSERAAVDRASRDLRVFVSNRESRCDDCGDDLDRHGMDYLSESQPSSDRDTGQGERKAKNYGGPPGEHGDEWNGVRRHL